MYFDDNNIYFENNINITRNNTLFNIEDGFNKGNMFKDLYSKYKNHEYKLKVKTQKDELLYKIQMYYFAMKDMNLYLDIHPSDDSMLNDFNKAKDKFNELKQRYENDYGPLCMEDNEDLKYNYVDNPWPWGGK